MPQHPMPDVIPVVKLSVHVGQPVHPDVVEQAAGPNQVELETDSVRASSCSAIPRTITQWV